MMDLITFYTNAKTHILGKGYGYEVEWCEKRESFDKCTSEAFFFEYVYVVLNSGMREQIARKIYDKFCENLNFDTIGHLGKRVAIRTLSHNYPGHFLNIKMLKTDQERIEYLATLPWIGNITKYHLARNIGIDCIKPDRHLVRLAEQFGFKTPQEMCKTIQDQTGQRLGVIDVILWRYCNLGGRMLFKFTGGSNGE